MAEVTTTKLYVRIHGEELICCPAPFDDGEKSMEFDVDSAKVEEWRAAFAASQRAEIELRKTLLDELVKRDPSLAEIVGLTGFEEPVPA